MLPAAYKFFSIHTERVNKYFGIWKVEHGPTYVEMHLIITINK